VTDDLVEMFYAKPVDQWAQVLDTADIPHDYFITFAAIVATGFSLVMPFEICTLVISTLVKVIIPKEDADFIIEKYLPALGLAVTGITLTGAEKSDLLHKFGGMLIKILYAFVW